MAEKAHINKLTKLVQLISLIRTACKGEKFKRRITFNQSVLCSDTRAVIFMSFTARKSVKRQFELKKSDNYLCYFKAIVGLMVFYLYQVT